MSIKPYAYAVMEGIAQEMEATPTLSVIGQGSFTASLPTGEVLNLATLYPFPRTVASAAIDEGSYAGWAAGMAAAGVPAIARFPHMASRIPTEYIFSNISKLRYMTGGQGTQQIVLWMAGADRRDGQAGQHTDVGVENSYLWMAGLKVVAPSNAYDAKGLMIAAIRDPDPVVFCHYSEAQSSEPMEVPDDPYVLPIGDAVVRLEGTDLTIAAWAPSTIHVAQALPDIEAAGISAEFIDLRSLKPLDVATLTQSVEKTGRLLVVEGGNYTGGYGGHVVAEVAQQVSGANYKRLAFPDAPGPGAKEMIRWMVPDALKIIDAAKQFVEI